MDAMMDVMGGLECAQRIRQTEQLERRAQASYIIAQTANASEDFRQRCLQTGM